MLPMGGPYQGVEGNGWPCFPDHIILELIFWPDIVGMADELSNRHGNN